jgi:hypothetical protein
MISPRLSQTPSLPPSGGSSLDELLVETGGGTSKRGPGRPKGPGKVAPPPTAKRATKSGRLPRRSVEDIAKLLGEIIAVVKRNKEGLRAEQIRAELGLQSKEMPRILKEGVATKKLKTKGQKRATTYFAA